MRPYFKRLLSIEECIDIFQRQLDAIFCLWSEMALPGKLPSWQNWISLIDYLYRMKAIVGLCLCFHAHVLHCVNDWSDPAWVIGISRAFGNVLHVTSMKLNRSDLVTSYNVTFIVTSISMNDRLHSYDTVLECRQKNASWNTCHQIAHRIRQCLEFVTVSFSFQITDKPKIR
jgi:hypothetical protein